MNAIAFLTLVVSFSTTALFPPLPLFDRNKQGETTAGEEATKKDTATKKEERSRKEDRPRKDDAPKKDEPAAPAFEIDEFKNIAYRDVKLMHTFEEQTLPPLVLQQLRNYNNYDIQRLGMEECRAWTKEPVLRTFAVQLVALTLMRLLRYRLDAAWGAASWWSKPEWYRHKQHPSILDVRRLFWRYRQEFSQFLQELEDIEKVEEEPAPRRARAG